MHQAHNEPAPEKGANVEESAHRALCASYRKLHFRVPGSPHSSRVSEVDEGAPVNANEGWTERVKHGKNVAPQTCQHLNSVRPDDCSTLWGLERLPADLCRALGRVYTRPSALPDVLLRWPGGQDARVW